jgi:hypothetical protein
MRIRHGLVLGVIMLTACENLTPPLVHSVTHDIVMVTTSVSSLSGTGITETQARHDTVVTTFTADFTTRGAQIRVAARSRGRSDVTTGR